MEEPQEKVDRMNAATLLEQLQITTNELSVLKAQFAILKAQVSKMEDDNNKRLRREAMIAAGVDPSMI